jgi:hypothetical protein
MVKAVETKKTDLDEGVGIDTVDHGQNFPRFRAVDGY